MLFALGLHRADRDVVALPRPRTRGKRAPWISAFRRELRAALAAARENDAIIPTQYGRPFSDKALGMRMQDWTGAASIAPGYTLHSLRKTLGKMLAEGGATTRQIMAILGQPTSRMPNSIPARQSSGSSRAMG